MEDMNQAVETPVDAPVADVTPAEPVAVETPVEAAPEVETPVATVADEVVAETGATDAEDHPAHNIIDELDDAANALGSYAYSIIRPLLDKIRNVL
jgi:hypothetical protein